MSTVKPFRMTTGRRLGNRVVTVLVGRGWAPARMQLLTTTGRRSGLPRTTPVTLAEVAGQEYLVAPYGAVDWVHNVRASGHARLRHGSAVRDVVVRELGAQEAGPVLAAYVELAPVVRPFFDARPGDPVERFAAEADRHPVFALAPAPLAA